MYKIGFIGNSCTGKTTSAFNLIKWLKINKTRTGYCNDICRFVTFDPNLFDTDPKARLNVLFSQISNELENEVRADVDYLITERTVIDWYLYYLWTCKNTKKEPEQYIADMVSNWIESYDLFIYMDSESMYYVNDGYRPASTKIRDEINEDYITFFGSLKELYPDKVIHIKAPEIADRIDEVEEKFGVWFESHKILRPSK